MRKRPFYDSFTKPSTCLWFGAMVCVKQRCFKEMTSQVFAVVPPLFRADVKMKPSCTLHFSGNPHRFCFGVVMNAQSHNLVNATSSC